MINYLHFKPMSISFTYLAKKKKKSPLPAPGVMHTSPVIMPWTAPTTLGLPSAKVSRMSHVNVLIAVHTWVLRTARDASVLATNGAPPLNPVHPIHRRPAPASIRMMLLGGVDLCRSLSDLGPTCSCIGS